MSFGSEFAAGFASGIKLSMDASERAENRKQRQEEFDWKKQYYGENQRIQRAMHHVLSPEEEAEEKRLQKNLPKASSDDPGSTGGTGGKFAGNVEKIIREEAVALGVDPEIAVRVAKSEGGLSDPTQQSRYINPKTGKRETSYGPFQLLIGGGLGDKALKQGIDPRRPENLRAGVRFALSEARRTGWGPWYGAAKAGIGRWAGLRGPIPSSAGSKIAGAATAPAVAPTQGSRPAYIAPGDTTSTQAGSGDLDAIIANPTSSPETVAWAKREKARLYGQQQAATPQSSDVAELQLDDPMADEQDDESAFVAQGGAIPRREYHQTGRHLGQFPTTDEADQYAEGLHQREEERIMKPAIPARQRRKYAPGGTVDYFAMGQSGNPFKMGAGSSTAGTSWKPRKIGEDPWDFGPKAPAPPGAPAAAAAKAAKTTGTPLMQGPGKGPFSWSGESRFDQVPTVRGYGANNLKNLTNDQLAAWMGLNFSTSPEALNANKNIAQARGIPAYHGGPGGIGVPSMDDEQQNQMLDYARYRLGESGVNAAQTKASRDYSDWAGQQAVQRGQMMSEGNAWMHRAKGGPITRAIPVHRRGGPIRSKVEHYATGGAKKQKAVEKDTGLVAADYNIDDYEAPTLQPRMHLEGRAYGGPYAIPRQEDIGWGVDMVTPAQARSRERRAELAAFRAADDGSGDPTTLAGTDPTMGMLLGGMGGMGMGGGMPMAGGGMGAFGAQVPMGQPAPGAGSTTGYRRFAAGGPADPVYGTNTGVMRPGDPRVGVPGYYNEPQDPWVPNKIGDVPQEYGPHPPPPPPVTKDKPKPTGKAPAQWDLQAPQFINGAWTNDPAIVGGPGVKPTGKAGSIPIEDLKAAGWSGYTAGHTLPAGRSTPYAEGGAVAPGSFGGGIGGGTSSRMDWRNYWDQPPEYFRMGPGGSEAQHGEVEQLNARRRGPAKQAPGGSQPSQGSPNAGDPGLRRPYDTPKAEPPSEGSANSGDPGLKRVYEDPTSDPNALTPSFSSSAAPAVAAPVVPDEKPKLATPEGSGRIPERNTPLKTETAIPPRTTPKKSKRKSKSAFEATVEDGTAPEERIETPGIKTQPATYAEPDENGIYDPRKSGKPLPQLKPGQSWQDLGDGTFKLDVGSTGGLGESRGIEVGGPQPGLELLRADDEAPVDPSGSGMFQLRRATGLARGGAIPSRYAEGGGVNDNQAARQRLLQRAAAAGLTEGDINRAQSDPSRYGPYFFEGQDSRAPRGKPATATQPGRTAQPAKPGAIPKRAPTIATPPDDGGAYHTYSMPRSGATQPRPRKNLEPPEEVSLVPPEETQAIPLSPNDEVPQAPRSYVQPSPLPPSTMPVPASATQNVPYGNPEITTPRSPPPSNLPQVPPVPRDENLPPPAIVNDPRRRDRDPIGVPRPGRPVPPPVDPQRTERPPRQVRQIDPRLAPAMGWVYVLGPDGQPTQVPANAAHLYRPLPPPGPDDQLPARPRTSNAGVRGGQPRVAPVLAPQPFPERRPLRPPVPAVAQGGMIPHYAAGGYYPPEGPGGAEAQHGEIEAMPPPAAIPSRTASAAGPFAQPAPAAPPAAGPTQAPAQPQMPRASREEQDAIVNPNRELNPALPSFVNGLQWFERQVRDLMDGSHDPRAQLALRDIASGESGGPVEVMSQQEVKQVEAAVDPQQKLDPGQRNIKAYQDIYDFYLAHDQPEKAAATAMALTLYNKRFTQTAGAMANEALKNGNVETAVQWLDKAFDRIPDYKDLEYKLNPDGTVQYAIIDRMERRVLEGGTLDAKGIAAIAGQMQAGGFFDGAMGKHMQEAAAWRGRNIAGKPEKGPSEGDIKREENRMITNAYEGGVTAGTKGDRAGIMAAARDIYDRMGHTEQARQTVDAMFRDANMDPPASIQAVRDQHPPKEEGAGTLKERDRIEQDKTREKLKSAVQAAGDDPQKRDPPTIAYADQAYRWAAENRPPPNTEMISAMPEDVQATDPRYNAIKTGAFLILKRNDIDPGYAASFMKTLLDPANVYGVDDQGRVHVSGMTYPLFVPAEVFTEAQRFRKPQQKAA